jgi:hypothetical protein
MTAETEQTRHAHFVLSNKPKTIRITIRVVMFCLFVNIYICVYNSWFVLCASVALGKMCCRSSQYPFCKEGLLFHVDRDTKVLAPGQLYWPG